MKKILVIKIILFIIYTYVFAFFIDKIHGKIPKWIEVPTDMFGTIILIFLLWFIIKPIVDKYIP